MFKIPLYLTIMLIKKMHGTKLIMLIFAEEMRAVNIVIHTNRQSKWFSINLNNQILLTNGGLTTKSFILSQPTRELLGLTNTLITIRQLGISLCGVRVLIKKLKAGLLSDWKM